MSDNTNKGREKPRFGVFDTTSSPASRRVITKIKRLDQAELKSLKRRIDLATAAVIVMLALLVVRLWYLQIYKGPDFVRLSESNRIRVQQITAPRGNIYDRNWEPIVTNRPRFDVVWIREDAPDPDIVIKRLSTLLQEDISKLLDRIREGSNRPKHMPIRMKEDIDWPTLVAIENNHFNLPGVSVQATPVRQYDLGNFSTHLIGYLGEVNQEELHEQQNQIYQSGDLIGKMGIEKLYDSVLRGEKGRNFLEVDVHGFVQNQLDYQEAQPGSDLQLTLDLVLQTVAEQAMKDLAGAVVAMEVNTGRLLALASSPALPLDDFIGGISSKAWKELLDNPKKPLINKTIQGQYPPGSTYKMITAYAGLDKKIISPESVFYCSGSHAFGNRRYGCWKKEGHGPVNLQRAIAESCDVYFYIVGQRVGVNGLAEYAHRLGLGQETGILLEHEKSGLIPTSDWKIKRYREKWQDGETLSIAIGQGFNLVTPLQLCRMTALIANDGILYRPQYVLSSRKPGAETADIVEPIVDGKIAYSSAHLQKIRDGMVAVVHDARGTAKGIKLNNVTVAGKTGTAQVVRMAKFKSMPESQLPYIYRDHAWFTCYAPAEKPEIAVTVLVEHGGHGGSAAAPIAKKVLEAYFSPLVGPPKPEIANKGH